MAFATISLKETAICTAFRSFVLAQIPTLEVVKGQVNRVPEPKSEDFIIYWPLRHERLGTNILTYSDTIATGS